MVVYYQLIYANQKYIKKKTSKQNRIGFRRIRNNIKKYQNKNINLHYTNKKFFFLEIRNNIYLVHYCNSHSF